MGWIQVELTGTKNGVNQVFTFPRTIVGDVVMIFHNNGVVTIITAGTPVAGECLLVGETVTMGTAPNAGDRLIGWAKTGA